MAQTLVIIALSLIIVFLILVIIKLLYKNSPEAKGKKGEREVAKELKRLPKKNYIVLNDILFQNNKFSTQIDHIVVSIYGIFVIETKNYSGLITGNEDDENWTKTNYGNSYNFRNPILQNASHIKALKHILYIRDERKFIPIVVFSKEAKLNVKTTTNVVNIPRINKVICHHRKKLFSKNEMNLIAQRIHDIATANTFSAKRKHIKAIQEKEEFSQKQIAHHTCPRCGSKLEERNTKQGLFLCCKNRDCKFRMKL